MVVGNDMLFIAHVGDSSVVFVFILVFSWCIDFIHTRVVCSLLHLSAGWLMQVQSCSGKAEVLTNPHRPYGSNKVCLQEIRRIREAGGWVCFSILGLFPSFYLS